MEDQNQDPIINPMEPQPQETTVSESIPAQEPQPEQPKAYDPMVVNLPEYEGPLDLLLDLIKKNEMDIYNIQIAVITKQYLDYLQQLRNLNLEIAGEFLVIAATLLFIKSKLLLPPDETAIDDEDGQDPRAELVRKLLEYQAFKEAAKELGLMEHERGQVFTRQVTDYYLSSLSPDEVEIDTFSADLFDLLQAFRNVLQNAAKETFHEVFEEVISIDEKMLEIKSRLTQNDAIAFKELLNDKFSKNELIVTFLALLEIIRSRFARVIQDKQFGEIQIKRVASAPSIMPIAEDRGEHNAGQEPSSEG